MSGLVIPGQLHYGSGGRSIKQEAVANERKPTTEVAVFSGKLGEFLAFRSRRKKSTAMLCSSRPSQFVQAVVGNQSERKLEVVRRAACELS